MPFDHIRNILVTLAPADGAPASPALRLAGTLAKDARAHLTVRALGLRVHAPYSPLGGMAASYVGEANAAAEAAAEQAAREAAGFLSRLADSVDCAPLVAAHGALLGGVVALARVHDLTIVNRAGGALSESEALLEALLFETGRPVLVAPPEATEFRARRVVIAWDGGGRAARAVADATPFLKQAEDVDIVCVTNEKDLARHTPGADLAGALVRHGVKARVSDILAADRSAGRAIREHAATGHADLIVMGAFVHSRLRQMVLGGVTDSMLREAETPLFMSY